MKGLLEYVRCKALGFKVKGVYYSTRLRLNIQSNTADCVFNKATKGLLEYVRCKALGFKVKGVYYSTRLSLNIQSNTADCVL